MPVSFDSDNLQVPGDKPGDSHPRVGSLGLFFEFAGTSLTVPTLPALPGPAPSLARAHLTHAHTRQPAN